MTHSTMTEQELIERLEKATGPDRKLDCEIAVAVGWFQKRKGQKLDQFDYVDVRGGRENWPRYGGDQLIPALTESIDAALALVPEGLSATVWFDEQNQARVYQRTEAGLIAFPWSWDKDQAATPAIALCIAALKARVQLRDVSLLEMRAHQD